MNDGNGKTIIRPTLEALSNADPTLFEMIRYIRYVIDRKDPSEAAHNAALIYLAVFTAFKEEKLLELDWVPSLSLDIGDKEFEIVISKVGLGLPNADRAADSMRLCRQARIVWRSSAAVPSVLPREACRRPRIPANIEPKKARSLKPDRRVAPRKP
jgi:hypothetical protein